MAEKNSFDQLVSGLSSDERKEMLQKMQGAGGDPEQESLAPIDLGGDESISFEVQLKNESIFFRLWLWIKSLITNTPSETLFNDYKVAEIARNIERAAPDVIDYKRKLLVSTFFNRLTDLKKCADFFKPYCSLIDNEGDFYVFLGTLGMPQIAEQMSNDVDPYSIPLEQGAKPEQRVTLLRRMDDVMANIPTDQKATMYACARGSEWLAQFVKLPFNRFLAQFSSVVEGEYTCSFKNAETEITEFARVLCNGLNIPKEVLESLYLYYQENGHKKTEATATDSAEEFIERAHNQLSMMHGFLTAVPMRSVGRVVRGDVRWSPDNFTGAEDWFVKYKMGWKKLFDQKWEARSNDCKKEILRQSLKKYFDRDKFPLLPDRPWASFWGDLHFRYELTGGFLCWYFREQFPTHELTLKTVMTEGNFMQKDNRTEFTEAFNEYVQVSIGLETVRRNCESGGEVGALFKKLENERTLQSQQKAEQTMHSCESDIGHLLYKFGEASRRMTLVMAGICGVSSDSRYDSLTNMDELGGKENALFRKRLQIARDSLDHAFEIVKELEPIDTPSMSR